MVFSRRQLLATTILGVGSAWPADCGAGPYPNYGIRFWVEVDLRRQQIVANFENKSIHARHLYDIHAEWHYSLEAVDERGKRVEPSFIKVSQPNLDPRRVFRFPPGGTRTTRIDWADLWGKRPDGTYRVRFHYDGSYEEYYAKEDSWPLRPTLLLMASDWHQVRVENDDLAA
jgi:hypothetical protein